MTIRGEYNIQEEREERDIRKAEMEANKAENMIEHEAEIYSRPARTWFQTERQKKQVANRARDASLAVGEDEDEDDEEAGGRSKQGASSTRLFSKN